ncbi:hypothetical protein LUZ62_025041 [Rhynchospora pubera]|uniref:ResB-like domain-containing protein n=1 Tax=Rhynchospora pubera TaxID=906938 RepID=A0AAV8H953_9POAL|nr:hypothetical protein LUZ62_025041 [Rhynchospora pubera]
MSPSLNPLRTKFSSPLKSPSLYNLCNSRNLHLRLHLSLQIRCKQGSTQQQKPNPKKKIVLFGAAPPVLEEKDRQVSSRDGGTTSSSTPSAWRIVKRVPKRALALLANLPLAIAEMGAIAALMALATLVEQGESLEFYTRKYSEENPVLGFFTWKWIVYPGFDHMFTSPIFLGLLVLLGASLMACTYTTQIPLVKVARRWSFLQSSETIRKQEFSDSLTCASVQDLGAILMGHGYEVFLKGPCLYAFKGLASRFAPIGVHLAMILIMVGSTLSAAGTFKGSITVPQGLNFVIGDVLAPIGFLSNPLDSFNTEVHANRFYMDYYESGEVSQFYTDISLLNFEGKEIMRKTIRVNDPLRYGGITIYQTDWGISALQISKNGEGPFNLAVAPLQRSGDFKLFGTFLPTGESDSSGKVKGISMLARDLQSIVLYDEEGKFVGVRRPSSKLPIEINGTKIVIEDAIGSTGLDLKADPGVPIVYTGFGALMLTTTVSLLSHSQVWALQDGSTVVVGAKRNRAKREFSKEMNVLLNKVPELVGTNDAIES